jgi:hypothetical protein
MSKLFNTEMTVEQVRQAMAQRQAGGAAAEAAEQAKRLEQVNLTLERVSSEIERLNATVVQLQDSVRDTRASQGILGRALRICSRTVTAGALLFVAAAAAMWFAGQQAGFLYWPPFAALPAPAPQPVAQAISPNWWDTPPLAQPAASLPAVAQPPVVQEPAEPEISEESAASQTPIQPDFQQIASRSGSGEMISLAERRFWKRASAPPQPLVEAPTILDGVTTWQVADLTPGEWLRVFGVASRPAVQTDQKLIMTGVQLLATGEETFKWLRQLSVSALADESMQDPESWWRDFIQTHPGAQDWDLLKASQNSEDLLLSVRSEPSAAAP